jgi:hypothetical protein
MTFSSVCEAGSRNARCRSNASHSCLETPAALSSFSVGSHPVSTRPRRLSVTSLPSPARPNSSSSALTARVPTSVSSKVVS